MNKSSGSVFDRVVASVAAVTRYPLSVLTPHADLEDELGIDSVKRAEILAVLSKEFQLAVDAAAARTQVRTLQQVAALIDELGATQGTALPRPSGAPDDLEARVVDVLARVTRYPLNVLTPEADLEDELGIDSVKQAEILATLAQELTLPEPPVLRARGVRTIAAICQAIRELGPAAAAAPVTAPAPAPRAAAPAAPPAIAPGRPAHPVSGGMERPFAGKVALVTGSGRGLGKVLVQHLARLGATVVVNSFHSRSQGDETASEIQAAGGRALHLWGSVSNEEHVDQMFDTIERELGGLDLLICNASDGFLGPFERITPKDWDRAFRTNIVGSHLCAVRAARSMERRGGGSILTMSTVTSQRYLEGFGSQGVVKAAVESLTRYLAFELAPRKVRVNCLCAGPVYGELITKFPDSEARIKHWESITPQGALCAPEEVAEVAGFLLRSAGVTGAVWVVDRGVSGQIDGQLVPATPAAVRAQPPVGVSSLDGLAAAALGSTVLLARG